MSTSQDANGVHYTFTPENKETRPLYEVWLGYNQRVAQFPVRIVNGPPRRLVDVTNTVAPKGVVIEATTQEVSDRYMVRWELFGRRALAPGKKSALTMTVPEADPIFETCGFVFCPDLATPGLARPVRVKEKN